MSESPTEEISECAGCPGFEPDSLRHLAEHLAAVHDEPWLLEQMTERDREDHP